MAKTPMELLEMLIPFLKSPPGPPSPTEQELAEDDRVVETVDAVPGMPNGKGIFVQTVERATKQGTPQALADRAKDLGLSWITLIVIWQHSDRDRIYTQIESTIAACNRVGVDVWIWGWPESGASRIDKFVAFTGDIIDQQPVKGLILNAEKPFYGKNKTEAAKDLCTEIRARLGHVPIGLSSYGPPYWHPAFPWAPFAAIADFGMPQIYDMDHKYGASYPQQCMASWVKSGFPKLIPTWGASNAHTADQMRQMIQRTPRAPACCWWDMNWIRSSTARAGVVREMSWFT